MIEFAGPALALVLLLGGWMTAQTRDEHGLPRRGLVSLGQSLACLGLLVGVLTVPRTLPPTTYASALAVVLLIGLALVRGAGRLAIGWTSAAEIMTSAVGLGWTRPWRAAWSLVALAGGLGLAAWLAGQGEPAAGLLGGLLVLAPGRWWLPQGAKRERTRTGIEKALAGLLSGGIEWEGHEANLRGAPVKVRFEGDATPSSVAYPLRPGWKASSEENLEEDLRARLSRWGYWLTHVDASTRYAVAESVEPLPTMLPYQGETATDRGEVIVGMARLSRRAAAARGERYGSVMPFVWDARIAPHGLVVGTTGAGKSSTICVLVTSWCRNPNKRAVLLDPAAVEFGPFRGRQGVLHVAETVATMTAALREVDAEMRRRLAVCTKYGVKNVWSLPHDLRPTSWLVVVDEVMDYLDKTKSTSDEAKAENEFRAEAADIIQRLEQLARKADIHLILAGQRLDKDVVSGRTQNNSPFRCLTGVQEAESTERHMIRLTEVEPEDGVPGRGVAKTVRLPESEVQFTYLEPDDMPHWLPLDDSAEREWVASTDGDVQSDNERGAGPEPRSKNGGNGDDEQVQTEDKPKPPSGNRPRKNRDDAEPDTVEDSVTNPEQKSGPEQGDDQSPNADAGDPADEVDPLDYFDQ